MTFVLPKAAHGLYRTPGWARITDDELEFDIPEGRYRVAGYLPDYEELPTKETYGAANKAAPSGSSSD
jgi:hypothetical protein